MPKKINLAILIFLAAPDSVPALINNFNWIYCNANKPINEN